jgi:YppF-like protein
MNIHDLKMIFSQQREYATEDVNDLLDFAKKAYIHNEISINDYRNLVRELEALGATIPDSLKNDSLIENA